MIGLRCQLLSAANTSCHTATNPAALPGGVTIASDPHPENKLCMCVCVWHIIIAGLIGTAPSQELLDIWNEREAALVEAGPEGTTLGGVLHTRPLGGCILDSLQCLCNT